MAMPISAFQGGGVVDAVAGHRHHFATALQGADETQFLLGFHAGKDIGLVSGGGQCRFIESGQFPAGYHPFAVQADLARNGLCRDGMVAGDHLDPDAGRVAVADGADRRLAWRIDHADQAEQRQVGDGGIVERCVARALSAGQQQDAHSLPGQRVCGLLDIARLEWSDLTLLLQLTAAKRQQLFYCAFQVKLLPAIRPVRRGHVLAAGIERELVMAWQQGPERLFVQAAFAGDDQQGRFSWVAGDFPVRAAAIQVGIVAQGAGNEHFPQGAGDPGGIFLLADRAFRCVAVAADRKILAGRPKGANGHGIFGQGAGFVRADNGGAAQCFDGRQVPDDRPAACHAGNADGQGDGDGRRQSFRNRADG
jgi:hypothetical protein